MTTNKVIMHPSLIDQLKSPDQGVGNGYKSLGQLCREAAYEIERLEERLTAVEQELKLKDERWHN